MQTNEFYRVPISAITNIPNGDASPNLVEAVKMLGRTMNPTYVVSSGFNPETYEEMFIIIHNGKIVEAALLANLEYVDAFVIDQESISTIKEMFS